MPRDKITKSESIENFSTLITVPIATLQYPYPHRSVCSYHAVFVPTSHYGPTQARVGLRNSSNRQGLSENVQSRSEAMFIYGAVSYQERQTMDINSRHRDIKDVAAAWENSKAGLLFQLNGRDTCVNLHYRI